MPTRNPVISSPSTASTHPLPDGTALLDLPEAAYRRRLTQFLFSATGAKFRLLFRFDAEPSCTDPAPDMVVSIEVVGIFFYMLLISLILSL